MKYTFAALALVAISAFAVKVTFPTEDEGWTTKGSQLIKWDSVSTDPKTLGIQLFSPGSNNGQSLVGNMSVSEGSYIYTPSSDLTAGNGYRISLVTGDAGILAQSPMFNVTDGTSTVTPTSGMPSQTASTSSMSASGSASSAAATSGSASHLTAPMSGLAVLVLGAIGALA